MPLDQSVIEIFVSK